MLDFKGQSFDVVQQSVIDGAALPAENTRWKAILADSTTPTLGTAHMGLLTADYPNLARAAGDLLGGGLDLVVGSYLQWNADSSDPRFTNSQRIKRAGIAGGGSGLISIGVGVGVTTICTASAPICITGGIVAGLVSGSIFDDWVKPGVFKSFPGLKPVDRLQKYQ